jgi:hypothetical protein
VFLLRGERLAGAQEVMFYGTGIGVTSVLNTGDDAVAIQCAIAPDCPTGEHVLRLRTASGLSEARTVWVGALPVVEEVEPNGDFERPQRVGMNSTVHGVVTSEDVDWYSVEAKAGERITAEIEGMRLGRSVFDPAIAILNSARFELAVSDDSALLGQDGTASVVAPADGVYVIQVREAAYGGSDAAVYRLHVGTMPRPLAVWPPGGRAGEAVSVRWLGDPVASAPMAVTLAAGGARAPVVDADETGVAPSPNWLAVSDLPVVAEAQPDAAAASPAEPDAPVAFHGVIREKGEVDRHRFKAKKGEVFDLRVLARRLRTSLDAVLDVFDAAGAHLTGNDDVAGADPELRFTAPADGVYEARVRDHRGRGGETLVYRLEVDRVRPGVAASVERVDTKRPQFLQGVVVPRGGRMAVMMRADRRDVGGPAAFEVEGLPSGMVMRAEEVPAELGSGPVVFEAAADAPLAGALVGVKVKVGDGVVGGFRQTLPLVIGAPNDTVYYQAEVDRLAVAVTEAAPFRVSVEAPATPLLRVGQKALKVRVERDVGFAAPVVVHMVWNPPGVSSAGAITIAGDQTEGVYPLDASGDAALKTWKVGVLAHAPVSGGDVWISSQLVDLTVAEPLTGGAIQMAATERGKPALVLCKLEGVRAFEGKARVTLMGLPPKAACAVREISAQDKEVVFEVTTESDAPVGQHKGLFCQLELEQPGGALNQRFAFGGVLRIDNPPPAPVEAVAAAPPPPPAPAGAAPARPLSRLEQLRKEAEERKGAK